MLDIAKLQSFPVFGGLRADIIEILIRSGDIIRKSNNEIFFNEGDPADALFVLLDGKVEVIRLRERPYHVNFLEKGDCFGEMGLIDHQPRSASVRVINAATVIRVPLDAFFKVYERDVKQYSMLQMNMAREVSRRLRKADDGLLGTYF